MSLLPPSVRAQLASIFEPIKLTYSHIEDYRIGRGFTRDSVALIVLAYRGGDGVALIGVRHLFLLDVELHVHL